MAFRQANALMAAEYAGEEQAMERERATFLDEQSKAQSKAEERGQGKSLWSSLGSKLGGLGGGLLAPALIPLLASTGIGLPLAGALAAGIATGGGSWLGSKVGEAGYGAQGGGRFREDIKMADMPRSSGKYMSGKRQAFETGKQAERDALQEYQDSADRLLHQGQVTGALTSGITAGMGTGAKDLFKGAGLSNVAGAPISESFDMMDTGSGALDTLDLFGNPPAEAYWS